MAPLPARMASARAMARHAPIRVSGIERRLKTRYTADTLAKLVHLFPKHDFIWLMGADNLATFHRWERWRFIANTVPIAVIARPGYDRDAHVGPAMGWLRRSLRPARQALQWTEWRLPALVLLRFRPDRTSATRLRAADPAWHRRYSRQRRTHAAVPLTSAVPKP
jgi:nicotinate-nucleotide adenylyltransferase